MKPGERQPFDPGRLREVAGDKVFARGQAYADHGDIALLSMNDDAVLAAAFGSDDYTVWLEWPGRKLSGHCTCSAYDDSGFCKHLVPTALVANRALADGSSPDDALGRIATPLGAADKAQLLELVLEFARSDWRALRALHFELGLDWDFNLE